MSTEDGIPTTPAAPAGYGGSPKTDAMAVTSLILGILSIPGLCFCFIGWGLAGTAIILGFISRSRISQSDGSLVGREMALAGLILGCIAIGINLLWMIFFSGVVLFDIFHDGGTLQNQNNPDIK